MSNWLLDANFGKNKIENVIVYLKNADIKEDIKFEDAIEKKGDACFINTLFVDNINLDGLWKIMAKFFGIGSEIFSGKNPIDNLYKIKDKLGTVVIKRNKEIWTLTNAWPHSVNFGELCYNSDDSINLEITWGCKEYNSSASCNLGISSRGVGN